MTPVDIAFSSKTLELTLPAPIAIPFARFNTEILPTDKTLALFDTVEAALRFLTYVCLADVCSQNADPTNLRAHINDKHFGQSLTMGQWIGALRDAMKSVRNCPDNLVSELGELSLAPYGPILDLRNCMIHNAGSTHRGPEESERLLREAKPLFLQLMHALAFLGNYDLVAVRPHDCSYRFRYEVVRFMGMGPGWRSTVLTLSEPIDLPENVPLLCPAKKGRVLPLWPFFLCEFQSPVNSGASLYVLASGNRTPDGFKPDNRAFLYTSCCHRHFLSRGSQDASLGRIEWLCSEAATIATVGSAESAVTLLRNSVERNRSYWPGRLVHGKRGGEYQLKELLGAGGQGAVYLAVGSDGSPCCIKLLSMGNGFDAAVCERFDRQVAAFERCGPHRNLVAILDHGEETAPEGNVCFLAMELAERGDLARSLLTWGMVDDSEQGPRSKTDRLNLFLALLNAVDHLHSHGYIHRDIKPSNVLLADDGRPLLSDLDLICWSEQRNVPRLTSVGTPIGTMFYAAPEQRSGLGEATTSSDVYSLGLMLHDLLAGPPPNPDDRLSTMWLADFSARFGSELAEFLKRCTYEDPAKRFQDASEMLNRLSRIQFDSSVLSSEPIVRTSAAPRRSPLQAPPESSHRPSQAAPNLGERIATPELPHWDRLSAGDQKSINRVITLLQQGKFAQLTWSPRVYVENSPQLLKMIVAFSRAVTEFKTNLTANNEAEIGHDLKKCIAVLCRPDGIYRAYSEQLRPMLVRLTTLFRPLATSPEVQRNPCGLP